MPKKPPETEEPDPELTRWRLRIARLKHGWATTKAAASYVETVGAATDRTYKSYEEGQRRVPWEAAEKLAKAFNVSPQWLRNGSGETREQLLQQIVALQEAMKDMPTRVVALGGEPKNDAAQSLNQLTSKVVKLDIKPSQLVPAGRIPVLLAEGIASFLAGERDDLMAGPTLPVSEEFAGPDHFCYEIGPSDTSMVGTEGDSFPPRTVLIINTDAQALQDETPPFYVMARPKGMKGWLFRRLESPLPLSVATEYTLRALNPAIDPIRVSDPAKWQIAGKLAYAGRRY